MKPLDKNYLYMQFWYKIHTKKGAEFQGFFEEIMGKAFPDFQIIHPYGKEGDGGNDGYIKKLGIYYQVYAPNTPVIKESEAAKKLVYDFEKLKINWDQIAEIKKYLFVYNDRNVGSTQKLEAAITKLEQTNPNIEFGIFNSKKLEETFFTLDQTDILNLGFDIDSRKAISNAYEYLNQVELALDRENGISAIRIHSQIGNIIKSLQDEKLDLEYELLQCRCLQKLERFPEAKILYQNISKRYPDDPRPLLYLAEIYLFDKKYEENKLILEEVDQNHWLLKLQLLVRKSTLGENIDVSLIDEKSFPEDSKLKSNFYRLYSLFIEQTGDLKRADSFIEKAIYYNPDRFNNYVVKLSLIEQRLYALKENNHNFQNDLNNFLKSIEEVENKFSAYGDISDRSKAFLLLQKLNVNRALGNHIKYEELAKNIFNLILNCYFDQHIENMLVSLLWGIYLPKDNFSNLIQYLMQSEIKLSDQLSQLLIIQFNLLDCLFTEGKEFFNSNVNQKYLSFIDDIEKKGYERIIALLNGKVPFAIVFADSLINLPELRKLVINNLPSDNYKTKEKLLLRTYLDEQDYDTAFNLLKGIDLSNLNYFECQPILQIVQKKKAWDLEILLIEKLLPYEEDIKIRLNLKLQLFIAKYNLEDYLGVIEIGEKILSQHANQVFLNDKNKESLLAQTIQAYLKRGEEEKAYKLLTTYNYLSITSEFKVSIESEVYLKNNLPHEAQESIITGVKIKKRLSPEEYASLFYLLVQIENRIDINLQQLPQVESNCFVKLKNQERWYYIGDEEELDATKIDPTNDNYALFINKNFGNEIIFPNQYSSKEVVEIIEMIFTIDKYIQWQSSKNFERLSRENRWAGAKMIEVPHKDDSIDTQYLISFFQDLQKEREPLFEMFCKNNIPLAFLALNEGSLPLAIGKIQQENKGFINFSSGIITDLEKQRKIANKIINEGLPFYIDGTSALFLSEIGMLKKIHNFIPNFKVPQSVITMLLEIADKFRFSSGEKGNLNYAQGRLTYSSIDKEKSTLIRNNFISSIKLLESNLDNVISISHANKNDCLSENKIHSELCDACILAQIENIPILTEDYLYLQMNALETKKKVPEFFSSIILLRVLYEQNKLHYDEYLEYFGYLSSYRCRFLSLNPDDIFKAVFGDEKIIKVRPENIRKLNFPLTLSEDYGVPFQSSFNVLVTFLLRIIIDDTISIDIIEKIYVEILYSLPIDKNKKVFGRMLLEVCTVIINKQHKIILSPTVQEKVNKLSELTEIFNYEKQLWVPNT